MRNQQGLQGAWRLVAWQIGVTVVCAVAAILLISIKAGLSALLGGLVSAVPNAYFARKLFKHQGAQAAKQIVNSFYKGEALKIILSITLFVLVFKYFNIVPLVFFIVYIIAQAVFWFAPMIFVNKRK